MKKIAEQEYKGLEATTERELPEYVGTGTLELNLTDNQLYALEKKYLTRDEDGEINETTEQAIYRMARTMAEVESQFGKTDEEVDTLTEQFYFMIANEEFSPAGRIWTNAGTHIGGLFNCYVLPVPDDLKGIYDSVRDAALIHKNGGGTGYNFSDIRPRGTYVQNSKGIASGVVSFIGQFDKETEVINSGNRRGANMGILDVDHPDILDFVYAKAANGEITNFNVSIGATDRFMQAVEDRAFYDLQFKGKKIHFSELEQIVRNVEENKVGGSDVGKKPKPASLRLDNSSGEVILGETKVIDTHSGEFAGRIAPGGNVQLYAPYVLETVANLAWQTGDPGVIFLDAIERGNQLPNKGPLKTTNPCGEQPLHHYDACNLGSIVLSTFVTTVNDSGVDSREIDYSRLGNAVVTATRFMDNVNDVNKGPIPQVEETVLNHRRIGMGVMGWSDLLADLSIPYDSEEAYTLAEKVMGFITDTSKKASVDLALEKGVFPAFSGSTYDDGNPENRVRNLARTTIAPTGTISMVYDVASGIEPFFAIQWRKNIRGGDTLRYTLPTFIREAEKRGLNIEELTELIEENHGNLSGLEEIPEDLRDVFKTSHEIPYEAHIRMQAAFQRATDNAVSKTINMTNESTVEDIKSAYFLAWKEGLKGMTIYRDGSLNVQVLETGHGNNGQLEVPAEGTIDNPLKLSPMMPAIRIKQSTPYGNMFVNVVIDPSKDFAAVETFATIGNAGDQEIATLEALARVTSMWVKSGGDLEGIIDQLEGIGSGAAVPTSGGTVKSLENGFTNALTKFEIAKRRGEIENFMLGKIDYEEFDSRISELLRVSSDTKGGWKNYKSEDSDGEKPKEEKPKNGSYKGRKCPNQDCKGTLTPEEGCIKCHSCGHSEC